MLAGRTLQNWMPPQVFDWNVSQGYGRWFSISQPTFTCSKSTVEKLEKDVKCVQS